MMINLPVNFDTSHCINNTLDIDGYITFELNKSQFKDNILSLKKENFEIDRFSSSTFNFRHFVTKTNTSQTVFKIMFKDYQLLESCKFELYMKSNL